LGLAVVIPCSERILALVIQFFRLLPFAAYKNGKTRVQIRGSLLQKQEAEMTFD
jgi:hypothetical protein